MTLAQIEALALTRLADAGGTYYTGIVDAINEGQRLFCLISLCLEAGVSFALTANLAFYNILATQADFVLPRRFYNSSGTQLRPATLAQLQALDAGWQNTPGAPTRYLLCGLDFLVVYPQPAGADTLNLFYARTPVQLVNPSDVPEIRAASHFALANYAAWSGRQVEGGQEFAKFQMYFQEFMDEAQVVKALVKSRTADTMAEMMPVELARTKR